MNSFRNITLSNDGITLQVLWLLFESYHRQTKLADCPFFYQLSSSELELVLRSDLFQLHWGYSSIFPVHIHDQYFDRITAEHILQYYCLLEWDWQLGRDMKKLIIPFLDRYFNSCMPRRWEVCLRRYLSSLWFMACLRYLFWYCLKWLLCSTKIMIKLSEQWKMFQRKTST